MNLIPIAANTLINPSRVGCIEQVEERGEIILYVWVDGQKYEYEWEEHCSIQEFIGKIDQAVPNNPGFVG